MGKETPGNQSLEREVLLVLLLLLARGGKAGKSRLLAQGRMWRKKVEKEMSHQESSE